MPTNYQNSVGWLGLQIAQRQRENDLQQQNLINQERREQNTAGAQQAVELTKHSLDAQAAHEDRKLRLADLMSKAADSNASRERINAANIEANRPKNESVVTRNAASAKLNGVKAEDIPKDTAIAQAEHKRKQEADKNTDIDRDAERLLKEKIAATAAGTKINPFNGKNIAEVAPGSIVNGVTIAARPGNNDPGFTETDRPTKDKMIAELKDLQNASSAYSALNEARKKLRPEDYGTLQGGDIPIIGGFLRKHDIPQNANDLEEARVNAKLGSPDELAHVTNRAAYKSHIENVISALVKLRSGAQASEPERERLGQILGVVRAKAFGRDPTIADAVLNEAIQLHNTIQERTAKMVREGGIRNDLPGAPLIGQDAADNATYTQQLEERAHARNATNVTSTDPDVRRKAIEKEVDAHIKAGELDAADRDAAIRYGLEH